jgi:hypothetical protein
VLTTCSFFNNSRATPEEDTMLSLYKKACYLNLDIWEKVFGWFPGVHRWARFVRRHYDRHFWTTIFVTIGVTIGEMWVAAKFMEWWTRKPQMQVMAQHRIAEIQEQEAAEMSGGS